MNFDIAIPHINGEFEAGVAVGVDGALPDDQKLPILTGATVQVMANYAAAWAHAQNYDAESRIFLANAAACIVITSCLRTIPPNINDGDYKSSVAPDPNIVPLADGVITLDRMRAAITLVLATKANFWSTNHHTGQGGAQGFVRKLIDIQYPVNPADIVTCVHMAGHWTSTLYILNLGGVENLRGTDPFIATARATITLSVDMKLRFKGPPAGTHRIAVAFEGGKRLARSVLLACPGAMDRLAIPDMYNFMMRNRASHHMGAFYMTGVPRSTFDDSEAEIYLGRIGLIIVYITIVVLKMK